MFYSAIKPFRRRNSYILGIWTVLCTFLAATGSADKTAADYYVKSLPGAPDGPLLKMHAGHIEVNPDTNGHLFFWHFQNRHIANRQRTVLWLNGGPGCSSEDGALMEIGPYRVKDENHLTYNDGSWDEFANVLFVDNPVGTGFSYVNTDSYIHELDEMADQFIVFLEKWFDLFPEYARDDLYIAGESYAGQHIPYIARAILKRNKEKEESARWKLNGLLIGNGWISPVEQYMAYLTYAYKEGMIERDSNEAKQLESQQAICIKALDEAGTPTPIDVSQCEAILQDVLRLTKTKSNQCYNMYDIRLKDSYPSCGMNWPPDLTSVTPYLRREDVVQALHIDADKRSGWSECSGAVGSAFTVRNSIPSIDILPDLLKEVPILLFSGAKDFICNHIGTEELIHNMRWNGGKGFELSPGVWAPRRDWTFEGEPAGIYQEARNLTYVMFYNSSHMVPFDYPRRSRDMLDRFMRVDIASIGGKPADSLIDGEEGLQTSVGGHPNSTYAQEEAEKKLLEATWAAYYKSGEIVLVVVAIAAVAWGYWIWRGRRRTTGYQGLFGGPQANPHGRHVSFGGVSASYHSKRSADLEAGDFDEDTVLQDLHVQSPRDAERPNGNGKEYQDDMEADRYSIGGISDEEDGPTAKPSGAR
ncbi:MAG: Cell death protease [Cirrosporium novae-zelandiae]|nr:MAG: Cell death protease [Cirrosporium novae-zelandiae]